MEKIKISNKRKNRVWGKYRKVRDGRISIFLLRAWGGRSKLLHSRFKLSRDKLLGKEASTKCKEGFGSQK